MFLFLTCLSVEWEVDRLRHWHELNAPRGGGMPRYNPRPIAPRPAMPAYKPPPMSAPRPAPRTAPAPRPIGRGGMPSYRPSMPSYRRSSQPILAPSRGTTFPSIGHHPSTKLPVFDVSHITPSGRSFSFGYTGQGSRGQASIGYGGKFGSLRGSYDTLTRGRTFGGDIKLGRTTIGADVSRVPGLGKIFGGSISRGGTTITGSYGKKVGTTIGASQRLGSWTISGEKAPHSWSAGVSRDFGRGWSGSPGYDSKRGPSIGVSYGGKRVEGGISAHKGGFQG